jgi:hypothetical protein
MPETSSAGTRLFIQRADLHTAHLAADPDAPAARRLADGEARFEIAHFALTANNITYAAFGDGMKYWNFFPSGAAATGCLPVWGYATVCESRVGGLDPGRRVWGYWPAGTHLVVQPGPIGRRGFTDMAPHRQAMAVFYNQYTFCDADPAWSPRIEGLQSVLRPLFATAFLIDDWLSVEAFFGARQVLLSSASSKTAIGTAFCLSRRRGSAGAPAVAGITSARHLPFVGALGLFDDVRPYDALEEMDRSVPTVYVDFAGDAALRGRVHQHFGDALAFSSMIGGTHWGALGGPGSTRALPGPRPKLFFAPDQIALRSKAPPEGWGPGGVQQRLGEAWAAFLHHVDDGHAAAPWLTIVERRGADALLASYSEVLEGRGDPREGLMLSPHDG